MMKTVVSPEVQSAKSDNHSTSLETMIFSMLLLSSAVHNYSSPSWCKFQFFGGCQGRRRGVAVTTVSNSIILGGWVTKVLKDGDKK